MLSALARVSLSAGRGTERRRAADPSPPGATREWRNDHEECIPSRPVITRTRRHNHNGRLAHPAGVSKESPTRYDAEHRRRAVPPHADLPTSGLQTVGKADRH